MENPMKMMDDLGVPQIWKAWFMRLMDGLWKAPSCWVFCARLLFRWQRWKSLDGRVGIDPLEALRPGQQNPPRHLGLSENRRTPNRTNRIALNLLVQLFNHDFSDMSQPIFDPITSIPGWCGAGALSLQLQPLRGHFRLRPTWDPNVWGISTRSTTGVRCANLEILYVQETSQQILGLDVLVISRNCHNDSYRLLNQKLHRSWIKPRVSATASQLSCCKVARKERRKFSAWRWTLTWRPARLWRGGCMWLSEELALVVSCSCSPILNGMDTVCPHFKTWVRGELRPFWSFFVFFCVGYACVSFFSHYQSRCTTVFFSQNIGFSTVHLMSSVRNPCWLMIIDYYGGLWWSIYNIAIYQSTY